MGSESATKGVLTIAAGPVYVEFTTSRTHPPSRLIHAEFFPEGMKPGDVIVPPWERTIGGSVWKAIRYQREVIHRGKNHGPTANRMVFVTRIARERSAAGDDWQKYAFIDDGRWLENALQSEAKAPKYLNGPAGRYLHLTLKKAEPETGCDYTFHIKHGTWRPWPIMTICGGAALQLTWQDVLDEWEQNWKAHRGEFRKTIVFLTAVLRTQLLQTLSEEIKSKRPRTVGPDGLLKHARLVLDFGRTARRDPGEDEAERQQLRRLRTHVQRCVRHAHVVLADEHTATDFNLRQVEHLPRRRLVIRRITPGNDMWWQFRRQSKENRTWSESGHFAAPKLKLPKSKDRKSKDPKSKDRKSKDRDDVASLMGLRSARDISLATDLCLRSRKHEPRNWRKHLDPLSTRRPDELTKIPQLVAELQRLESLLKRNAISTLLIYGETGTGKEVVARWVHRIHPVYSEGVFHPVSCGRQRGELVQSELFGHVEGAFTGAVRDRSGAFAQADGGVLLLDDLDALDVTTQAMLLRVIETSLVRPVGSEIERPVDAFLIVTTNVHPDDLMQRTGESRLRADLYFRLVAGGEVLFLPPLRGQTLEIRRAARTIWQEQNARFETGFPFPKVLGDAVVHAALPGNYRDLIASVQKTYRNTFAARVRGETIPEEGLPLLDQVREWLTPSLRPSAAADPPVEHKRPIKNEAFFTWLEDAGRRKGLIDEPVLRNRLQRFCELWKEWSDGEISRGLNPQECRKLSGREIAKRLKLAATLFRKTAAELETDRKLPRMRLYKEGGRPLHYCELIVE